VHIDPQPVISFLLGGGGVLIARALWEVLLARKKGRIAHEDTTISRYKFFADQEAERRRESEAETARAERELRWYRARYAALWQAHSAAGHDVTAHPFAPPPDIH
jgi:hypothetical protein